MDVVNTLRQELFPPIVLDGDGEVVTNPDFLTVTWKLGRLGRINGLRKNEVQDCVIVEAGNRETFNFIREEIEALRSGGGFEYESRKTGKSKGYEFYSIEPTDEAESLVTCALENYRNGVVFVDKMEDKSGKKMSMYGPSEMHQVHVLVSFASKLPGHEGVFVLVIRKDTDPNDENRMVTKVGWEDLKKIEGELPGVNWVKWRGRIPDDVI